MSKTVDGETTYFVNDLNQRYEQVVQTYNDDGVIDTYIYGLQRIDSKGETNETYLYDGRGSVVGAVDNSNNFVSYSYTAYGELMPNSPQPTVFGYNAEATDFKTGMQYLRARYYDTGLGRFFQEDDYRGSFTNPISMNRYSYVHNNPVMGIDPSGYGVGWLYTFLAALGAVEEPEQVGAFFGGVISSIIYYGVLWLTSGTGVFFTGIISGLAAGVGNIVGQVIANIMRGDSWSDIRWGPVIVDAVVAGIFGSANRAFSNLYKKSDLLVKMVAKFLYFLYSDSTMSVIDIFMTNLIYKLDKKKEQKDNNDMEADATSIDSSIPESEKPSVADTYPCGPEDIRDEMYYVHNYKGPGGPQNIREEMNEIKRNPTGSNANHVTGGPQNIREEMNEIKRNPSDSNTNHVTGGPQAPQGVDTISEVIKPSGVSTYHVTGGPQMMVY